MDEADRRVAAMDIGSNSVRLMIADLDGRGELTLVKKELVTTRIYEGLARTGKLSDVAMDRTLSAIRILKEKADAAGASPLYCFATAAVREAANRDVFLARARKECAVEVEVLTEEAEASVGFAGVREPGPRGILDIGGGSTEIAVGRDQQVAYARSLKLGAVRALEKYPLGAPADPLALEAMRQWIAHEFRTCGAEARAAAADLPGIRWAGIGGTITTLAAIDLKMAQYDCARVQGHMLTRTTVEKTLQRLAGMTLERRRQVPGLQPERADIILGGAAIVLEFLLFQGVDELAVSDRDNLEGYLTHMIKERSAQ